MRNSCAVCSLAVMLCLVVCVSASAKVTQAEATAAVGDAEKTVKTVREKAQTQLENAKSVLEKVESSKSAAEAAASKSQAAANDNAKAKAIAANIKILSDEVVNFHSEAKQKLETAVSTLTKLLASAKDLEGKTSIEITPNGEQGDDYTVTNGKAAALKEQADALDGQIDAAVQPIAGFDSKANDMADKAKQAQLKDAHVNAIVAVATIESMLENADTIILQIGEKESGVSGIVDQMQKDCTTALTQSNEVIKQQCQIANDALRDATGALENAKSAKAAIETQKGIAKEALTKVSAENQEVSKAQNEASTAETCVRTAQQIVPKLNDALQTAINSVTSANNAKQKLQTALSAATRTTRPEQSVTNHEVKPLQDSVSADVKAIQTMMGEADRILQETENHKNEVNEIVQEMKALKTTAKSESNENINELCRTSEGELTKATKAVETVKTAKEAMKQQKILADAALIEVNAATEIEKAQPQVATATSCFDNVKQSLDQVRSALQTAENSVAKVNDLKQQLKTVLSTPTTAPRTKEVKETVKADPPVGEGTEPDQKDTTVQPTSKYSPNPSDNSVEEIKDALITGAQNVPTTALTGGKAPAPGANNDSAMTVSVPLLVALIASAVLQ